MEQKVSEESNKLKILKRQEVIKKLKTDKTGECGSQDLGRLVESLLSVSCPLSYVLGQLCL